MESVDYKEILDQIADGVYFLNQNLCITYWNHAAERISGYRDEETLGKMCSDNMLVHIDSQGHQLCQIGCPMKATIQDGMSREAEVFLHHKDGHRVPVWVRSSPIRDKTGTIIGAIEIFSDNSTKLALKEENQELLYSALYDRLTEIPNRFYFEKELEDKLNEFNRYEIPFGLLYIDIDHFKTFNDRYGHDIGDVVLKTVAQTLSSNIRSSDKVGRWGGEEFLVSVGNCSPERLRQTGERLRILVERSNLTFLSQELKVTISIGATMIQTSDSIESMLKRCDVLMYQSKHSGRNRVTFG